MNLTIVDPSLPESSRTAGAHAATLHKNADGTVSLRTGSADTDTTRSSRYIGPGWVDLHTHVYDGVTELGLPADRVGLDQGVHLLVDAGSAGEATLRGFTEYVAPRSETPVVAWINIGSHGLVHLRETSDPSFIDVDATISAIDSAGDFVRGVKVRSSGQIVGEMGLQPLQLGRLVARESGLPLMVHIGEAPPVIADVLDLLDAGDVVTHCFHGKTGTPWQEDGTPTPPMRRALDRGVLLDVGHGAASLSGRVARAAVAAGFAPHSISTDIHVRNINGPVHSLATVMTKLFDDGMPLSDVIAAVTTAARSAIRLSQCWRGNGGFIHAATVFDVTGEPPRRREYRDSSGCAQNPTQHIVPVATIRDGIWRDCT